MSDLNPSAMPLHFTLLFPAGTKGWDQETTHVDGRKRVTPREFFAYYTNVRDKASDYLFMAGRLFQEWLDHSRESETGLPEDAPERSEGRQLQKCQRGLRPETG